MTEPIPALVYHQPQLGRRPLFVALAILAIVFGLLAAIISVASVISYLNILAQRGNTATLRYSLVPAVVQQIFLTPAYVCLLLAGIAFLLKSRWVPPLLCMFVAISFISTLIGIAVSSFIPMPGGTQIMGISVIGARFLPAMARGMFDVMVLILLLNRTVRRVIYQATGIEDPLLPDLITR